MSVKDQKRTEESLYQRIKKYLARKLYPIGLRLKGIEPLTFSGNPPLEGVFDIHTIGGVRALLGGRGRRGAPSVFTFSNNLYRLIDLHRRGARPYATAALVAIEEELLNLERAVTSFEQEIATLWAQQLFREGLIEPLTEEEPKQFRFNFRNRYAHYLTQLILRYEEAERYLVKVRLLKRISYSDYRQYGALVVQTINKIKRLPNRYLQGGIALITDTEYQEGESRRVKRAKARIAPLSKAILDGDLPLNGVLLIDRECRS